MKALQDKCIANEGVICQFRKHQEIQNKEQEQYKEVVHTLNKELSMKLVELVEETHRLEEVEKAGTNLTMELAALREQMDKAKADVVVEFREEAEKARTNLTMELAALREQMDKSKADVVVEFRVSQPFFDVCGMFYGDGFDDCLKQVGAAYPNLNLSQITIDDTILLTPGGDDTVSEETNDSVHMVEQGAKDTDVETIVQLPPDNSETPAIQFDVDPFTVDGPSTTDGPSSVNPTASQALSS